MKHKVKIIGHRGFASMYPENSLIGFQKAAELGVDGIELDVHLTKDGEVVVHHDETIDRMTKGVGSINEMTFKELQKFHLRHRFRRPLTAERIPTLIEVFESLKDFPEVLVNIELKTKVLLYEGIEQKVLELVAEFSPDRQVMYSSFYLPTLMRIKQIQPDAEIAFITSRRIPHIKDFMMTFELDGIHPRKNVYFTNQGQFEQLAIVRPWTVNSRREITRLLKAEVAGIITKYPEKAMRLREQLN